MAGDAHERMTAADEEIVRAKSFAHFTTLMPDGSPHTTPVWVDFGNGVILVNTAEGRIKTANVRRDPRVALAIQDPENPYRMFAVRGRVVEVTNEGAEDHIDAMAQKYLGQERYGAHDPAHPRVLIKVLPERIVRMGYRATDETEVV